MGTRRHAITLALTVTISITIALITPIATRTAAATAAFESSAATTTAALHYSRWRLTRTELLTRNDRTTIHTHAIESLALGSRYDGNLPARRWHGWTIAFAAIAVIVAITI